MTRRVCDICGEPAEELGGERIDSPFRGGTLSIYLQLIPSINPSERPDLCNNCEIKAVEALLAFLKSLRATPK